MSATKFNPASLLNKVIADKYCLEELLGQGGFGAVYKSTQHLFGAPIRQVAVKVSIQDNLTQQKARDVFSDVFHLAAVLEQASLLDSRQYFTQLYDAGIAPEIANRGFLVTDFVPTDLKTQFDAYAGPIPGNQVVKWACQICRALEALHRLTPPLVHRDIKPENVLFGSDLNLRLVDFGLAARLIEGGYAEGQAGTPPYMAPEVLNGRSLTASDVYSVGVLLYEGLTGISPFKSLIDELWQSRVPDALHNDWMYDHKRNFRVAPPSDMNNLVDKYLDKIILRCLAYLPTERWQNATELLEALEGKEEAPLSDDCEKLEKGGRLREAQECFQRRFQSLCMKADAHISAGEHKDAATLLWQAWELNERQQILRDGPNEVAPHLRKLRDAWANAGNKFQADRFRKKIDERGLKQ